MGTIEIGSLWNNNQIPPATLSIGGATNGTNGQSALAAIVYAGASQVCGTSSNLLGQPLGTNELWDSLQNSTLALSKLSGNILWLLTWCLKAYDWTKEVYF